MTSRKTVKQPSNKLTSSRSKAAETLCRSIIEAFGGYSAIANRVDTSRQHVYAADISGCVGLSLVYRMAKELNVSPWTLSYKKLYQVFGEDSPSLETVVKDSPLLPAEKQSILRLLSKPNSQSKETNYGEEASISAL